MSKNKEQVWNAGTRPARIGTPIFNQVKAARRGRTIRGAFEQLVIVGLAVEKTMTPQQQAALLTDAALAASKTKK